MFTTRNLFSTDLSVCVGEKTGHPVVVLVSRRVLP